MVTLADLGRRVRAIKNIGKLTSAMKLVATAKLRSAKRSLILAKGFHPTIANSFPTHTQEVQLQQKPDSQLVLVLMASDKGLCGSFNNSITRLGRDRLLNLPQSLRKTVVLFALGTRAASGVSQLFGRQTRACYSGLGGRYQANFATCAIIADEILRTPFDHTSIIWNKSRGPSFDTTTTDLLPVSTYETGGSKAEYFEPIEIEGDPETLANLQAYQLAADIFYYIRENEVAELNSRANSMGSASENAKTISKKLYTVYHRTRQGKVTGELLEIASALAAFESMGKGI